jgi:hypothetical protein
MLNRINVRKESIDFYIIENPRELAPALWKLAVRMAAGWEFADGVLKGRYRRKSGLLLHSDLHRYSGHTLQGDEDTADMADTDQVSAYLTDGSS